MKKLLTFFVVVLSLQSQAQTESFIDSLHVSVLRNLSSYEVLFYTNETISNEDAMRYDTARFYHKKSGELIYINWRERSHTFHISGDGVSIRELLFLNGPVVFQRDFFYQYLNPQWHLEDNIDNTDVRVVESLREYYKSDGSALIEYEGREAEGEYKDRFTLLDSIPLVPKLQRRWSKRCDECIERDYLSVYRELVENKK